MKTYAMILQNRVIDVLKDRETEPYYPPDPSGNPVTAIPCDDTVTLGMVYDPETGAFSEYTPPEPEPTPEPQPTQLDRIEESVNKLIDGSTNTELEAYYNTVNSELVVDSTTSVPDSTTLAVAKIQTMRSSGATSVQSAITAGAKPTEDAEFAQCIAAFTKGYPEWVADDGVEPLYSIKYYPATKMAYICIALINRYSNYTPDVATNNYCPYPEPDADGIYPYIYGMMVWPNMRVRYNDTVYKCILSSGTYKLVYAPSDVPSVFTKEA